MKTKLLAIALALGASLSVYADTPDFDASIADIAHRWATINYDTPDDQKVAAFEQLATQSQTLATANPTRAEPLVWEAIILSGAAKAQGGLGALGKVKHARDLLLAAEAMTGDTMTSSVYCTLGSLYSSVPGWPIGYGDKKMARTYFDRAMTLEPRGIDTNYFYGVFLADQGEYAAAVDHLQTVLDAPGRPGREDADKGRRAEATQLLASIRSKHGSALASQ